MQTNKIVLGTVQLGLDYGINNKSGRPSLEESFKILDEAYEAGIKTIDTAEAYGNSQDIIGSFLANNPDKKFKVLTKFKSLERGSLKDQLSETLKKLSLSQVDAYSYHQFSEIDNTSLSSQLIELKANKLISKVGVSVYTNEELKRASSIDFIDVIQLPFNLFDNWSQRGEGILLAKSLKKEIHVRSIFLQGLFYMDPQKLPEKLTGLKENLKQIHSISKEYEVSLSALALQYALSIKEIDQVLVGVESRDQFHTNMKALNEVVPNEAFVQISKIVISNPELIDPRTWK